jgi:hypothetical protein
MAADRLEIYNGALLIAGDQKLASLIENREPRHLLDDVWNGGRGVRFCLEQAQWHFAMRASRLDYNPSVQPDWGFQRAFDKPTDWVNTSGVFQDAYLRSPLTNYADEVMYWFCDQDEIFVKYVSDDVTYGMDFAKWPESFTEYVKAFFASKIIRKLPGGADKVDDICNPKKGVLARALVIAKNKAAMTQPTTFPTRGTWARARHGGSSFRNDGGNPNSLIG